MKLEFVELLQGIFSSIFVVISIIVGMMILLKYFKFKKRVLFFVGLTWIGMSFPWVPDAINLVLILFFNTNLNENVYFFLVIGLLPIPLFTWLVAFTDLFSITTQKIILVIVIILSVIFEIFFINILLIDVALVGRLIGIFHPEYTIIFQIYFMSIIAIFAITAIYLTLNSKRSENPEIKLKGNLLFIAIILFVIGAIMDAIIPLTSITVIITRITLIISAVMYYNGFILPNWIKKRILKNNK
jgi:hypothetical protein